MKSLFERTGGTYRQCGDYLIPNLLPPEEHIDTTLDETVERVIAQLAEKEGVTESLKASDPSEWTRRMNNIKNRAMEIVYREVG